jgi:hypothetical protein
MYSFDLLMLIESARSTSSDYYCLSRFSSAIVPARPVCAIAFIKLSVDFGAETLPDRIVNREVIFKFFLEL